MLEYDEALFAKKELLSSQINTLELLKKFKQYRALREKELIVQNRFKKIMSDIKKKVVELESAFPKQNEHEEQMKIIDEIKNKKSPPKVQEIVVVKTEPKKIPVEEVAVPQEKKEKSEKIKKKKKDYEIIESQLSDIKSQLAGLG